MSQSALRVVALPCSTSPVVEALVDQYISATFARFERVLVDQLPALVEPQVSDPARALRLVDALVETLVGFAVGSTFGAVAMAVRRSFGTPVKVALDDTIARLGRGAPLAAVVDTRQAPHFFAPDIAARRPLLDTVGGQLQSRLCHAAAEARRHVLQLHTAIARVAADQVSYFASALTLLVDDDSAAIAFADHLGFGWAHYVAAIHGGAAPQLASAPRWQRARALWGAWLTRVAGTPVLAALTQEQVVAAGFVMRIG